MRTPMLALLGCLLTGCVHGAGDTQTGPNNADLFQPAATCAGP
jgi:hypothetical protein